MALMIQLTPTEDQRLQAAAKRKGIAPAEFAHQLLSKQLSLSDPDAVTATSAAQLPPTNESTPAVPENNGTQASEARDPERVARVRSLRGKFAQAGRPLASEELHQERQRDKAKEEALIQGYMP